MTRPSLPNVRSRRLGIELRKLRETADLTIQAASHRMERSIASVSRIENGKVALPPRDVALFLDTYGVTDKRLRKALTDLARDVLAKGWWQQYNDVLTTYPDFISLENDATRMQVFDAMYIPGLAQTPEYVDRVYRQAWPERPLTVKRFVDVRMARQRLLSRPEPPSMHFVIWEAALYAVFGDAPATRRQYERLCEVASLPNVVLQVLPFSAGLPITEDGGFTMLWLPAFGDQAVIHRSGPEAAFIDDPEVTQVYTLTFDRLRGMALSAEESVAMLQRLARDVVAREKEEPDGSL